MKFFSIGINTYGFIWICIHVSSSTEELRQMNKFTKIFNFNEVLYSKHTNKKKTIKFQNFLTKYMKYL